MHVTLKKVLGHARDNFGKADADHVCFSLPSIAPSITSAVTYMLMMLSLLPAQIK